MIEIVVRLAMDYFPNCAIEDSLFKFLNQIFPKIKPDKFDDLPSLKHHNF
jgi:hypothetical protein